MTIAAAYLVAEGLVLGADSTTTWKVETGGVAQLLNHAQKVFEIGEPEQGRLALCTWGAASIGEISHRTVAARLRDRLTTSTRVAEAVELLITLVGEERARQGEGRLRPFGYFCGGTDLETHLPRCFQIQFDDGKASSREELGVGEARFEGMPHFFARTFHGIDHRLPPLLLEALKKRIGDRVSAEEMDRFFGEAFDECLPRVATAGTTNLPIREAIDFVHTYLHVTVKSFKFGLGPPVCGGPIEIGFISTDRPFRWARHKPFDAAIVETQVGA